MGQIVYPPVRGLEAPGMWRQPLYVVRWRCTGCGKLGVLAMSMSLPLLSMGGDTHEPRPEGS